MKNLPLIYFDAKPPKLERGVGGELDYSCAGATTWRFDVYSLNFVKDNTAGLIDTEHANGDPQNCQPQTNEVV